MLHMEISTLLVYSCSIALGVSLGIIMSSISGTKKGLFIAIGFTLFHLFVVGTPFWVNMIIRPTNSIASMLVQRHCPDVVAASVMLFCGLSYLAALTVAVRKHSLFKRFKNALFTLIALFSFWCVASIYFVVPFFSIPG